MSCVLASAVSYYLATQIAWALTFPDSKVSLFFPPQAVLLCVLLVVPSRHWWAYVLTAVSAHFLATQQAGWPLLLGAQYLFARRLRTPSLRRVSEATLLGAGTVALGIFVFDNTSTGPNSSPALLYAPIPLLIWSALRFGLGGISVSMLIVTFQAIWGTMHGHGPFLAQSPAENALQLQLFLLVTATPLMLLAVVIEARKQSEASVAHKRAELEHVTAAPRSRSRCRSPASDRVPA